MNAIANQGVARGAAAVTAVAQLATRPYTLHTYGGRIHLLPQTWRFPSVSVLSLWQQWLLGDYTQNMPPLRTITSDDDKHLDEIELELGKRPRARKVLLRPEVFDGSC